MPEKSNQKLTAEDILNVLGERDREQWPNIPAGEIHSALKERGIDVTDRTVKYRLKKMREGGAVEFYLAGNTPVYWLPSDFSTADVGAEEGVGAGEESEPVAQPDTGPPATDGAAPAEGELANIVKGLTETRKATVQARQSTEVVAQRVEQLEEEVARLRKQDDTDGGENDDTGGGGWMFSPESFHQNGVDALRKASTASLLFLAILVSSEIARDTIPGVLSTPVPVFPVSSIGELAALLLALAGALAFVLGIMSVLMIVIGRVGAVAQNRLG